MVDTCIESYLDQGEEKLLKKTRFAYDPHGNVKEERIYDSNEDYAYTLYKTYNERGNLLSETDPFGNLAAYEYDRRGSLTKKQTFQTV